MTAISPTDRPPISADQMRRMTTQYYTEQGDKDVSAAIKEFTNAIYDNTILFAKNSHATKFDFTVTSEKTNWNRNGFFDKNRKAIFAKLEEYFPGCSIRCRTFCQNAKGNLYDISHWNPEKFTETHYKTNRSFITIDWSNTVGY